MACVAVNSLVRTIELEFLQPQPRPIVLQYGLIPGNEDLLQSLHRKLGFLIELFDENRMDGIQAIKHLETKLRDVAFRVEDEIEFQIVDLYEEELLEGIADLFGEKPQGETTDAQRSWDSLKLGCILERAISDIDAIHKDLSKVKMEYERVKAALNGRKTSTLTTASTRCDGVVMMGGSHSQPQDNIIMVGKDNEFQIVKKMLIQHSSRQREIVSIQGMGGIGKTTLARRVYDDPSIASHFDKQVWVVVSQYHNKFQILTDLLKSMGGYVVDNSTEEDQLAQQLYQNLLHQRYFVVIDDIWSVDAWDSIKACFPDNANGSRVLLTTRFAKVATGIGSNNGFSHQVQLLDQTESWNLFREKANKSGYDEFEVIGGPIADKCKGLPLAIVVAAGLFSQLHTLDEWKNVAQVLNSCATTTIDEECSRILSSSYDHLPHSLKACFLYLSIFPEDKEIHVKNVVKLWVVEGFVKASKDMSFDEVARRHIQELKDRNLILVSHLSRCGRKVHTFRMHDLVHSFCVREAKKENLLHVIYDYENESSSPPKYFRWVSIQSGMLNRQTLYSFVKNCRSIFSFYGVYISVNGGLLRVLYSIDCDMAYLVHLRCLLLPSLRVLTISDPFCCWNLQTVSVTMHIHKMRFLEFPQLQHLSCCYNSRGLSDIPRFFHQNLKSISGLIADQCTKELFTNIPNLKKVKILCEDGWSDCINNVVYSHQLQSLHLLGLFGRRLEIPNISRLVCLKNLMRLRFTYPRFEWNAINILSKLPKLEVLILSECICIDDKWKLWEKENFEQLICLEISFVYYLKHWEASACHFPNLERLVLKGCFHLVKIPADFAEILNLKSIELTKCLCSAVDSAKEIQEQQHEYGNDNMVVIEEYTIPPHNDS